MATPPRLIIPLMLIFSLSALLLLPAVPTVNAPAPGLPSAAATAESPASAAESPPATAESPAAATVESPTAAAQTAAQTAARTDQNTPKPAFDAGRVRGIYLTGYTAGNSRRLAGLIEFARSHGLNAMVIDAKNDDGLITFATDIPLAREVGSVSNQIPDVTALIETLEKEGIYPIARVVVFCDPLLSSRRPELAIKVGDAVWRDGRRLSWTNPNSREVWAYNVEIAKAAARAGFREVQFDYVRFPEKKIPGVTDGVSQEERVAAISGFLRYAREELKPLGVAVSADVFGLTTTVTDDMRIGQDYTAIAELTDYISPMIYPSHYRAGNYGLANPEAQPYETVLGSMQKAREKVPHLAPNRHRPWIQDFSLKHRYGKDEIEAQIRALADAGIPQFLLWNPANVYTPGVDYSIIEDAARVQATGSTGAALPANERGRIMVLVYHQIGPREDRWVRTPAGFRQDLEDLYERGYRPVNLRDLAEGRIDLPAGKSPVVLTFDDATEGQFRYLDPKPGEAPEIDPDSAVGILLDFHREHPDWPMKATFYVNGRPFGQPDRWQEKIRFLVEQGMEVGNHTLSHADLSRLDARGTAAEIGGLLAHLRQAVPDLTTDTLSLPFGAYPRDPAAARGGVHEGRPDEPYEMKAFLLVGAGPAPSPHSREFDPMRLPRIQAVDPAIEPRANLTHWLSHFDDHPEERYVSDGDPARVTPAQPPGR